MPAPENLFAFFLASLLLAVAPGPDNLFVLSQSALHGRSAGLVIILGLCSGLLVHTLAVATGVAAVIQTSDAAFLLLKGFGAAYLLYLAWHALAAPATPFVPGEKSAFGYGRLYRRGVVMNVSNPKVSIFFLAFLPQFVQPAYGSVPAQMIFLGALFIAATLLVFGSIALLAGYFGERLGQTSGAQKILNRTAAAVFIALALKLAFAGR